MVASISWSNRFKAIVFGLGLGLALLTSGNWWRILTDHVPLCAQPNCVADFVMFYAQATLSWEDRQSLYDLEKQLAYQKKLAPIEQVLPAVYPPSTFLLMAPLALIPFSTAFLAVTVLNLLLLAATLRLLTRALSLTRDQSQWLALFALCNFGVHAVVFYGQTSALVLYFMTRHIIATKQLQPHNAGAWAGLLCIKPQFLLIPHLVFLLRRNWRGLATGVLISMSLIIGGFALIGLETTKQYFSLAQRMVSADNDWWNQWRAMHNLRALTIYWLPGNWQPYVWAAGCVGVIAAVILINLRAGENPRDFAARWIVNLLGLLIVIPHLFTHDLTLLVVPAALFLSLRDAQVPVWLGVALAAVGLLPAVNYLLPTIMATTLVVLFLCSLRLTKTPLARS
jgi:hypothetical protein